MSQHQPRVRGCWVRPFADLRPFTESTKLQPRVGNRTAVQRRVLEINFVKNSVALNVRTPHALLNL